MNELTPGPDNSVVRQKLMREALFIKAEAETILLIIKEGIGDGLHIAEDAQQIEGAAWRLRHLAVEHHRSLPMPTFPGGGVA